MYPIYTYMYRILIAIFCLSVYAVQLVPPSNVNTSPGIILSRFLAITIVIACKCWPHRTMQAARRLSPDRLGRLANSSQHRGRSHLAEKPAGLRYDLSSLRRLGPWHCRASRPAGRELPAWPGASSQKPPETIDPWLLQRSLGCTLQSGFGQYLLLQAAQLYRIYTYMYRLLMYLRYSRTVDRRKLWSRCSGGAYSSL